MIYLNQVVSPGMEFVEGIMSALVNKRILKGDPKSLSLRFFDLAVARHALEAMKNPACGINDGVIEDQQAAIEFFLAAARNST